MTNKDYFVPKNRIKNPMEHKSPSGKYRLVIELFDTGKNTWSYSQGTVYHGDDVVGVIQRNYSSFPVTWIEDHNNGHDYLVGGENYQGQTVLELDTGKRRDFLPEEAAEGFGFCWCSHKYLPNEQLLLVNGCYWACPYEYRFYDFSDPMNGWPHLEVCKDDYIEDSSKKPTIDVDGFITAYQTVHEEDFEDRYPECDKSSVSWDDSDFIYDDEKITIVATKTYKITDGKLIFLREDISDIEKEYREKCRIADEKYQAWKKEFTTTDHLYLAFDKGCKDPELKPESSLWTGYTHDTWCPDYQFDEARWGRDIYKTDSCRIGLEWGIKTGPVKVTVTRGHNSENKFWMEHSVESMQDAFEYAKEIARGIS